MRKALAAPALEPRSHTKTSSRTPSPDADGAMNVPSVITADANSTSLAWTFCVASAMALQKYMSVVVSCPKIARPSASSKDVRCVEYAVARSMKWPTSFRARAVGTNRRSPRNQLGWSSRRTPSSSVAAIGSFIAATNSPNDWPCDDPAGERHEQQDHREQRDQPEQAFDHQGGRALDRLPRQPDGLVETPAVQAHGARRDDAEVAADEVRAAQEPVRHDDALPREQDLPAPDVGEDADQLHQDGGDEPRYEDPPVEALDLRPQLGELRGHELESLQPEEALGRRLRQRHLVESAVRLRNVDRADAALAAVASRPEAPVVTLGGADEHGPLRGRRRTPGRSIPARGRAAATSP